MGKYILKRCLWMVFVLIGTAVVIFSIMYFVPTDIVDYMMGSTATEAEMEAYRTSLGLNDPYIVQLGRYLVDVFLHFDFGTSYLYGVPVLQELANRVPRTLALSWTCLILETIVGLSLGINAALHQNKWQDRFSMTISMLGVSLPGFWVAMMLVVIFSVKLNWLPPSGIGGVEYYILPVISCAIAGVCVNARQMRSAMLEVIRADYVATAKAKGMRYSDIVKKHILPNALVPIVTVTGGGFARSIAGTVVIETVFSIPGVGLYMLNGIKTMDYPVVQGGVIILAFFSATVMLLVDIVYAMIDPRIKAEYSGSNRRVAK